MKHLNVDDLEGIAEKVKNAAYEIIDVKKLPTMESV